MYLRYSAGFLIASLIQAGIVLLAEALKISSLNPKVTVMQLVLHILTGQVAGYILLYLMKSAETIRRTGWWVTGFVYGLALWGIVLSINSMRGVVAAPWTRGIPTIVSSMIAFVAFGLIAAYTVKKYQKVEA